MYRYYVYYFTDKNTSTLQLRCKTMVVDIQRKIRNDEDVNLLINEMAKKLQLMRK